jgi:N-acetyl-gamma-glutamyl-phosphate reductase
MNMQQFECATMASDVFGKVSSQISTIYVNLHINTSLRIDIQMNSSRVRVGVVGASGYSGLELLRILAYHEGVEVTYAAGSRNGTEPLRDSTPFLPESIASLRTESFHPDRASDLCDAVFVGLPSGASGAIALELWKRGKTVIDLSGDLRLPKGAYESWYKKEALVQHPKDVGAVYGLTEWNRTQIQSARLIANPGCYATAALLALLPVVRSGLARSGMPIVIDAKSGVSGAGRKPAQNTLLGELQENFYAYKVGAHQHTPEIQTQLGLSDPASIVLTTQLLPTVRGIFISAYIPVHTPISADDVMVLYQNAYEEEPFIHVHPPGRYPELKHVRGSNLCHIGFHVHTASGLLQVFSVIDNLQKGAAGQAVQNFNLIYGFPETTGLRVSPMYP